jgi:hypothetical protein
MHYVRGGRYVGRGRVVTTSDNWAVCRANVVGGTLSIDLVTCKHCITFLRLHRREERP